MILIYPIGVPTLYFTLLVKHRKFINPKSSHYEALRLRENVERELQHISFLYQYYRPGAWYFEVVDSLRRIVMCAGLIGISSLPRRACYGCGLAFLGCFLFRESQPYLTPSVNAFAVAAQWPLLACYFGGVIITGDMFDYTEWLLG
jgi:hypothetical protein